MTSVLLTIFLLLLLPPFFFAVFFNTVRCYSATSGLRKATTADQQYMGAKESKGYINKKR